MAAAFAAAWARPDLAQAEWMAGVKPYVTPELAALLASTDPARVPSSKVTGDALLVSATATDAIVNVPTDGGLIRVSLIRDVVGWAVSGVAPAGQPSAVPVPATTAAAPKAVVKPRAAKPAVKAKKP
jgi:hypothetical protein